MAAFCSGQSVPHTLCMQQRIKCTRSRSKAFRHRGYRLFRSRDATPQVLTPEAGGTDVRQCDVAEVDVSNMSEGYIMVNYTGGNAKAKLQLCSDCCGDRSSNLLLAAYHRCCQHDRSHYRCLPGIPAAPDLHPACLRSSGSCQPEAHPVRIR